MCFDVTLQEILEKTAEGTASVSDFKEDKQKYIQDLQRRGFIEIGPNGEITITDMGRGILDKIHSGQGNSIS